MKSKYYFLFGLVFLICATTANAITYYNDGVRAVMASTLSSDDEYGYNYTINSTMYVWNISKVQGDASTGCKIYNSARVLLATGTYTNNDCMINGFNLTPGTYYLMNTAAGARTVYYRSGAASEGVQTLFGNWTSYSFDGVTWTYGSSDASIYNITVSLAETPRHAITLTNAYNGSAINAFTARIANVDTTEEIQTATIHSFNFKNGSLYDSIGNATGVAGGAYFNLTRGYYQFYSNGQNINFSSTIRANTTLIISISFENTYKLGQMMFVGYNSSNSANINIKKGASNSLQLFTCIKNLTGTDACTATHVLPNYNSQYYRYTSYIYIQNKTVNTFLTGPGYNSSVSSMVNSDFFFAYVNLVRLSMSDHITANSYNGSLGGLVILQNIPEGYTPQSFHNFLYENHTIAAKTITTTNGTIYFPDAFINETMNITLSNISGTEGQYFNKTIDNWILNTSVSTSSYQAHLGIVAKQKITNITIQNFNVSVNGSYSQFNSSNSSYISTHYLDAGRYNVTTNASGYLLTSSIIDVTPVTSTLYTMYLPTIEFNITLNNSYNHSRINNFTALITHPNGYTEAINATGGLVQFYGIANDSYRVDIYDVENNTYFNQTYTGINIASPLAAETYQAIFNITTLIGIADEKAYGVFVNITNLATNYSVVFQNDNSTFYRFVYLNVGNYTYLAMKPQYSNVTANFTASSLLSATEIIRFPITGFLDIRDEKTNLPFNINSTSSVDLLVFCSSLSTQTIHITSVNQVASINCAYKSLQFSVEYGNVSYYRNILYSQTGSFNLTVFLIDLTTTRSIYNNFVMDDLLKEYILPRLYITKFLGDVEYQITADYIDMEKKVSAYLIENDRYTMTLKSDNNPDYVLGYYGADISGTKEIRLYDFNINVSSPIVGTTDINTYAQNTSVDLMAFLMFNDTLKNATIVYWKLYNTTVTSTDLIYNISTTSNPFVFEPYNITKYYDDTVYSVVTYTGADGVNYTYAKTINENFNQIKDSGLFSLLSVGTLLWIFILFSTTISLYANKNTGHEMVLILVFFAAVFKYLLGLTTISIICLILSSLLTLFSMLTTGERNAK